MNFEMYIHYYYYFISNIIQYIIIEMIFFRYRELQYIIVIQSG